MGKTLIEQLTQTDEDMKLYQQERAILEVTELICTLMERKQINKAQLAEKLGRSKGYITQLLNGEANMTLRTISDVLWALDSNLHVHASLLSLETQLPRIIEEQDWSCILRYSPGNEPYRFPFVPGSEPSSDPMFRNAG